MLANILKYFPLYSLISTNLLFLHGFLLSSRHATLLVCIAQMITLGGDAELELVDTLDPFAEGVVFTVRPPKKSWKAIANLSGGEKVRSVPCIRESCCKVV